MRKCDPYLFVLGLAQEEISETGSQAYYRTRLEGKRQLLLIQGFVNVRHSACRVESNVVLGIFDCECLGGVDHRGLAGVVPDETRTRSDTCGGSDGHERAAGLLFLHVRDQYTRAVIDRL